MAPTRWLFPDAVLWDGALLESVAVEVSPAGELLSAGKPPPGAPVERLPRRLLLPGLVDVHSHAFQRTLRGRTQARSPDVEVDDFWTWREVMYQAALQLDPEGVYLASRQCFLEMALAGVTAVGEFHYLHHQPDGRPYDDPNAMARALFEAAAAAGVQLTLLDSCYLQAGPGGEVLEGVQRRFSDGSGEAWSARCSALLSAMAETDRIELCGGVMIA